MIELKSLLEYNTIYVLYISSKKLVSQIRTILVE